MGSTYLTFIGAMNLLGVALLACALRNDLMDAFLRRLWLGHGGWGLGVALS